VERIPVHIVTGAPGSGKSALIARLCAERRDWFGLVNAMPAAGGGNLRVFSAGCPCCTGRVVMQVSLARGLRETRAVRALVELGDPAHAATLARILGELPLSLSVVAARPVELPGASGIGMADLGT
jgi:G3E family GTPase